MATPIFIQLQLGITSAIVGALIGLALRRSWFSGGVLVVLLAGLYLWGTKTAVSDDLANDARATGEYLLANADVVPSGDAGFAKLLELAFLFAEDNSHGTDAVHPNKAAILALGVIRLSYCQLLLLHWSGMLSRSSEPRPNRHVNAPPSQ